jgi:hypothetical protein
MEGGRTTSSRASASATFSRSQRTTTALPRSLTGKPAINVRSMAAWQHANPRPAAALNSCIWSLQGFPTFSGLARQHGGADGVKAEALRAWAAAPEVPAAPAAELPQNAQQAADIVAEAADMEQLLKEHGACGVSPALLPQPQACGQPGEPQPAALHPTLDMIV